MILLFLHDSAIRWGEDSLTDCEQETSVSERYTGVLAEREGFEPSIELLDPITV
jgi:hypothetical protein